MAFIFTCGTHTFTRQLKGYEHVTAQCQNCGNFSATCHTRWEWFTFCFVPLIPFSLKPWPEVGCRICNFHQDLKYRPDVQQQGPLGAGGAPGSGAIPMQSHGAGPGPGPGPGQNPSYQPPPNQGVGSGKPQYA